MKWSEVTEHPAFKSRSAAEQEATREEYFREVVAPKFAPDQLPAVRQQFDADTRIRKQDLPAGVAPSTRGTGLATAFEQADPRRTDVADPSKTFGQGQGQGLAGVMSDIRGNEAARTQRLTTFKGASGDTYTDPTAPSTTPEGASVLDQPPPQGLAFVDASRMQRDLKKRADAAMQTRMAGAKIGPATPDQVQAMDLNEAGAGPVNRGARAGFAQMGQIGLGAMRLAGDLVGSDTVSGIAAAGGKAAGAFEQGAMQGLEGGEKLAAQVTSSIMNSMPALAMGVAGGPALRTLFAQSTLSEYNAGRDAGFSVTDSLGRAGIMGFGEALGEKFGLSEQIKLIKSITKGLPQGELAKVVGSLITKEIPGEQLTTAIQFMADKIGPAALKPNATLADYLEAAADTLKVTVGQMAVMGGGPAAINAARNTYAQANQAAQAPESAIAREMNDAAARYAKFFAPAPEEAAAPTQARASSIKRFDESAAAWGLNPKAAAAVREQAGTKPADDVPGFLARAMAALNKRGMYAKPVDEASVAELDKRLRPAEAEKPAPQPPAEVEQPDVSEPDVPGTAPGLAGAADGGAPDGMGGQLAVGRVATDAGQQQPDAAAAGTAVEGDGVADGALAAVPFSAFNGDMATGLDRTFLSEENDGSPVPLNGQGFTDEEVAALEAAGLATNGRMSREQWGRYSKEKSLRDAGGRGSSVKQAEAADAQTLADAKRRAEERRSKRPAPAVGDLPEARRELRTAMGKVDAVNAEWESLYRDGLPYFSGDGPSRKLSPNAPDALKARYAAFKAAKKEAQRAYDDALAKVNAATPAAAPAPVAPAPATEAPAAAPAAPMAEPAQQAPQAAAAAPATPEGDFTGLDTPSTPQAGPAPADAPIAGEQINRNWTAFAPESGTLSIPREQMPQISAEHRGALVQFLKSRGIEHQAEEVDAASLKPTQAEFSPKKVQAATDFTGGNRSILVSADGYILDGTHQWLSAREAGRPVKTIRLNAPIQDLLRLAHQFPSSTTAAGPRKAADGNQPDMAVPAPVAAGAADSGADQPGGSGGNVGPLADAGSGTPPAAAAPMAGGADPAPAGNGAQRDAALNDLQAGLQQLGGLLKPKATAPATDPTGDLSAPEGARTPPEAVAPQDLKPAAGMTFAMDGKRYTVKKAYDTAVSIEDEAGKVRNISRISEVWPKMLKAMAAEAPASRETKDAAAPAQQAPAQARVPDAAAPVSAQVSAPEIPVSETDKGKPAPAKPKVYKTRAGAEAAKAGNTQRLKKVQGGYILRQATDKEMEAADKAGKRLAGGGGVDVERDSLLQAIAKLGGISLNERSDTIGEGNRNIGGKMLFTSAGRPLDELARNTLRELGYVPKGEVEADGGVRWLRDAIKSEFMGTAKHHSEQGSAWMEDRAGKSSADMTDAEYEAQRAAYEAEQAEAVDDGSAWANGEDSLAAFTPEDLQDAGYTGLSPVEQAEVEQLLAEAESLGIDTEALREDAARVTAEESADAYHAEVKALLREAIAAARTAAAGADAAAARERGPGDGQPAGDQGQEGADQGLKRPPAAEGDRIRFTGKDGTVIDGMAVQVLDTSGGNYRIKIRTDEPAPQGGGNISRTVYSQDGTFEPLADEPLLSMQSEADLRAKAEREEAARRAAGDEQRRLAAAEDKRKRDLERAEKDRRAAEILAEREAAKKAEVDAAADSFELGQEPPKPVDRKVSTEQVVGQRSVFDEPAAPAASAQQVPDDGPTPNYKAGDRITPDKDVMEGDVVKYRGAEWMAKVKRGIGIPLFPMVDGKPQVSADTKKLVDVKANEVIHTGTNVYGYGGQPKPGEQVAASDLFGAKAEDVAIAKRDLEAQRRALIDIEDRMVGMAGLRPGMLEDALRSRKVPKALKDQRDAIREDMTRLREQIARLEVPVRDMEQYIKVAADSIGQLRKTDVYRVLVESNRAEFRSDIATYIKANRPDLAAEVDEVMAEQARGEAPPAVTIPPDATPAAADESPTFTEAQARKQFEWRDLGQKDGTKTHGLFFYLKPEDKGTGRAMGRGQVTRYDGSNGWQVDSEGQKYPALADAKKAAIDAAIPTLREQGWIEGEATPAAAPTTERPTELIELRKRLSVLEALRKCIAS